MLRKVTRAFPAAFPTPENADEPLVISLPGEFNHVSFIAYGRVPDPVAMVVSHDGRGDLQELRAHSRRSPGCQVTYTAPTWVGGNGFGASIDIRNTGPGDQRLEPRIQLPEWTAHPERLARHVLPARGEPDRHRFEQCSVERESSPRTRRSTWRSMAPSPALTTRRPSFTLNGDHLRRHDAREHRSDGVRVGADRRPGVPGAERPA